MRSCHRQPRPSHTLDNFTIEIYICSSYIEQFAGTVRVLETPVTLNYKVDIASTMDRKNLSAAMLYRSREGYGEPFESLQRVTLCDLYAL